MTKKKSAWEQSTIGIDYGETNIGIAFGKNGLVKPIKIISGKDTQSAITEIARYMLENKIQNVVMGLPLNVEGKETPQSRETRRFAKLLKIRVKKKVHFVNEYRTSKDSKTETINLGISKKRRKEIDHYSAALILKTYYNSLD